MTPDDGATEHEDAKIITLDQLRAARTLRIIDEVLVVDFGGDEE